MMLLRLIACFLLLGQLPVSLAWAQPRPTRGDACWRAALVSIGKPADGVYTTMVPTAGGNQRRDGQYPHTCDWGELQTSGNVPFVRQVPALPGMTALVTRRRDELFVLGGLGDAAGGDAPTPAPFLSRIDATQFSETGRTALPLPPGWAGRGALVVHADTLLYAVAGRRLFQLAPSGQVRRQLDLPAPEGMEETSVYDGLGILPDGNLLVSGGSWTAGCSESGPFRRWTCPPHSGSVLLVDAAAWQVLQQVPLPEPSLGQPVVLRWRNRWLAYLAGTKHLFRLTYAANQLSLDANWQPQYVQRRQTPAAGIAVHGDFVAVQNCAAPAPEPLSMVLVSQVDAKRITGLKPFTESGTAAAPVVIASDAEDRLLYVSDAASGGLAAIRFLPDPMRLQIVWKTDQVLHGGMSLLADHANRMLLAQDALQSPQGKAQLVWRDAETGNEFGRGPAIQAAAGVAPVPGFNGTFYVAGSGGVLYEVSFRMPPDPKPAQPGSDKEDQGR